MSDLKCVKCGAKKSFADASIADSLSTCGSNKVLRHTAIGPVQDGEKHEWVEA
jgi:predicted  nucleic acid-binding Zn-ribbon protein